MKRSIFIIGFLLICLCFVTGCTTQNNKTEIAKSPKTEETEVEIPVILPVDPVTNFSDTQEFVEKFNQQFEGEYQLSVEWLMADALEYRNKLKQWNVLDDFPALITDAGYDQDFYRILVKKERLVNLRPYMEDSDFWMKEINEEILSQCTEQNGEIYLSPLSKNIFTNAGILYNKEYLEKAGYEEFPDTWEEFFACLETLKQMGITPLALHGSGSYWVAMLLATSYVAGTEEGKEFLLQEFPQTYKNEIMTDMMEMLKRLYQYSFPDAIDRTYSQAAESFMNGEAAIIANGYWMFDVIEENSTEEIYFAAFPGNILMNEIRMSAWAIPKGYSEEITKGAAKALEYRIECETKDAEHFMKTTSTALKESYKKALDAEHTSMPNYQLRWEQKIHNDFFTEYMPEYLNGTLTTEEFLEKMTERAREINSRK